MTTTTTTAPSQSTSWTIDPAHSTVGFLVRHMMITNVRGEFGKVSGDVTFDPSRPEAAKIRASVDVASINTHDAQRDTHLRSGDFFEAERHPAILFTSKSVKKKSGGFDVTGDLTIRGVTREVVLDVEGPTAEHKDPWGNTRVGASAKTKIKRSDFGITWNTALEAGGVLVGDEVKIEIDVSLIRQK